MRTLELNSIQLKAMGEFSLDIAKAVFLSALIGPFVTETSFELTKLLFLKGVLITLAFLAIGLTFLKELKPL